MGVEEKQTTCPNCGSEEREGCLMPCWFKPDSWHSSTPEPASQPLASPNAEQAINFMQATGKGVCFAHGPYEGSVSGCPKWPACITDPQKDEYKQMAMTEAPPSTAGRETPLIQDGEVADDNDALKSDVWRECED